MTDGLRIAHLRIAPQWAILRGAILTFTYWLSTEVSKLQTLVKIVTPLWERLITI